MTSQCDVIDQPTCQMFGMLTHVYLPNLVRSRAKPRKFSQIQEKNPTSHAKLLGAWPSEYVKNDQMYLMRQTLCIMQYVGY